MVAKSKSQVRRLAIQDPKSLTWQLRRIADNLDAIQKSHTELPFLEFDAEWIRRAASVLEALKPVAEGRQIDRAK